MKRCQSFNGALSPLQTVSASQILRDCRQRIEDATHPEKKKGCMKNVWCFYQKPPLCFYGSGPFSQVLSQI